MVDLAEGLMTWVLWYPDYKQRLADGTMFDNLKLPKEERIQGEIQILNHTKRQVYFSILKSVDNILDMQEMSSNARRLMIENHSRNWKNLGPKDKLVTTGGDLHDTQNDAFVNLVSNTLMQDIPLKPDETDSEGNVTKEGDEKKSEG